MIAACVGCDSNSIETSRSRDSVQARERSESAIATIKPSDYDPDVASLLTAIQELTNRYNFEAKGAELSNLEFAKLLKKDEAKQLTSFANSILEKINSKFDMRVVRLIGESWYQVPHEFRIVENTTNPTGATVFTISHLNCGLHEYDFIVENEIATLVGERYDDLNIDW